MNADENTPTPLAIGIVVPCHNEMAVLPIFHARLAAVMAGLPATWRVTYVNDGSTDATLATIEALRQAAPEVALVNLSRHFGKEIATTAGLDHAPGDVVIVIDADLQDPPELIPELVAAWRRGFDTVYAQRRKRHGEGWAKRGTAHLFYRLMQNANQVPLPANVGDYRLMSRRVVDAVLQLREQHRFMKGLFAWVGYPACGVFYDRAPRRLGKSSWSYWRLWNLAVEGITGFTVMPLRIATYLGLVVAVMAIVYGGTIVVKTVILGNDVPGYPSLMTVILLLGGVQLITIGVIGEYLGRIFNETKRRPLYLLERYEPARAISPEVDPTMR